MNANEEGEICVYSCASVVRKSALGRPETKWGLARIERAKPSKAARGRASPQQPMSFYRPGSRVAVPTPNPTTPPPIWVVQTCCAPGPT